MHENNIVIYVYVGKVTFSTQSETRNKFDKIILYEFPFSETRFVKLILNLLILINLLFPNILFNFKGWIEFFLYLTCLKNRQIYLQELLKDG